MIRASKRRSTSLARTKMKRGLCLSPDDRSRTDWSPRNPCHTHYGVLVRMGGGQSSVLRSPYTREKKRFVPRSTAWIDGSEAVWQPTMVSG